MAVEADAKARKRDMIASRKENRKAFVAQKTAEKGITKKQANQRFYVQTRMSEMKAKGKTVTPELRKQLQQKFQSGDVSRKGFAAPKKSVSSSSSSSSSSPSMSAPGSSSSKGRSATSNMKGVSGFGRTDSKGSSGMGATPKKKSSGGVLGALKGAKNFVDNSLMGKDDSKRAADYILKGDYKKAAKSVGAAAIELGSLVGVGGIAKGVASRFGGNAGASGSRVLKGTLVKSAPKAITSGPKALGTGAKPVTKAVSRSSAAKSKAVAGRAGRNAERTAVRRGEDGMHFDKIKTSRTGVRSQNYSKSTGKPFTAKQNAALKKNYRATTKEANASRAKSKAERTRPSPEPSAKKSPKKSPKRKAPDTKFNYRPGSLSDVYPDATGSGALYKR